MVKGVFVPFDADAPLAERQFVMLEDYQQAVGGYIEAVGVPDLGITLYVNEEGMPRRLPFNARASFLWWHHVPSTHQSAMLLGNAVIVGPPDSNGDSTDVPKPIIQMLLGTAEYAILVRAVTEGQADAADAVEGAKVAAWYVATGAYADYFAAVVWSMVLLERRIDVEEARVVPIAGLPVLLRPTRRIHP